MKNDEAIRRKIQRALDAEYGFVSPSPHRQAALFDYATGGRKMKKTFRLSFGLVLALVLTLLTVTGAVAAVLLSAQEVVEQTAVPLAKENDTETLVIDTYTPEQLTRLIQAANENGITLDETAGIMRALRSGDGYWEDEAVMDICRAAFGGLFPEWTIEEKHWYSEIIRQINGYPEDEADGYPLPDAADMQPAEARAEAARLLKEKYPEAKDIEDPALYRRNEFFSPGFDENDQPTEPFYSFDFKPLDLTHRTYSIVLDRHGAYQSDDEIPALTENPYTAQDLESAVDGAYRAPTGTQNSWSQEAWHAFGEYLPGADRESGWSASYEAYLLSDYPLPNETDISFDQALAIAQESADGEAVGWVNRVLLSDGDRHVWKLTFQYKTGEEWSPFVTWEIDAGTGEILYRAEAESALAWTNFVLHTVREQAAPDLLTQAQAVRLAADALRRELGDETIPFTDPAVYQTFVSYMEWRNAWNVRFRTSSLDYGSCAASISEPDHFVTVTETQPMAPDGDTLYRRWQEVYGFGAWDQETWIAFSDALSRLTPTGWEGKLLQKTVYLPLSAAKISLEEAVNIAAQANDWPVSEATRATLLGMDGAPVWKIRLNGETSDWLYEIDGNTGKILARDVYKPDNYAFDNPIEMFTLRRDYAPAFLGEYGPERAADIAVCKAFADMTYDEPDLSLSDETLYRTEVDGLAVTFTALSPAAPSYRVVFTDAGMVETVEKLP